MIDYAYRDTNDINRHITCISWLYSQYEKY